MELIFGYDIITYNGPLPNCLNPKFIQTFYEGSKFDYNKSHIYFNEKWGCDYGVFISNQFNKISENKSIYDIILDRENGKPYEWFYLIEPHSGLNLFLGNHKIHDELALNFISEQTLNEVRNHNGKILINYTVDGGLAINQKNFTIIKNFFSDKNIPEEKVYLIFADFKLSENLKKSNINFKIIDYCFYLPFKSHEFQNLISNNENCVVRTNDFIDNMYKKKKDFLLLSRHWKLHRIFILNQLHRLGLENNLVSWEKTYYDQRMIDKLFEKDKNEEFAKLLKETSKHIDVQDLINVSGYGYENKEMYLDTYISIVTESIFFQEDINFQTGFISEKIWKPIGQCHPFILVAPSQSLKYIREKFGFKTFHPYIDETYDNVNDDYERLELIHKEIDKFSKKSENEKILFLENVKNICIFNQNKFLEFDNQNQLEKISEFLHE